MKWELVPYTRGRVLEMCPAEFKTFPHFIAVEKLDDTPFGLDALNSLKKLDIFASNSIDAIFSSYFLDRMDEPKTALKEWWRVLKVGGALCLYLPHKDFYPNVGTKDCAKEHKHDFLPADFVETIGEFGGFDICENQARSDGDEYSFFLVLRKRNDKKVVDCVAKRPDKSCAIVRYGGFGDMIQISSLLPRLKEQGYHVTLYTTPRGYEVIHTDPNLDSIVLQDDDQVPNALLGPFWDSIAKKYDKFINLSESVEVTLLALPANSMGRWPHEHRHRMLNHNYIEYAHSIAGLPGPYEPRFHPTIQERGWARAIRNRVKGKLVLWSYAGSSVHKKWPRSDQIFGRILYAYDNVHIATMGDPMGQILEEPWKKEPRVIRTCDKWSIRQSMVMCEMADLIVGPETGVLNAAGLLPIHKICLLSHSSEENLTKHWVNTTALTPVECPCYPCHMMHHTFKSCHEVKPLQSTIDIVKEMMPDVKATGPSLCMNNISVDVVWEAIKSVLGKPEREMDENVDEELRVAYG